MKKMAFALPALLVFLTLGPGHAAWADNDQPGYYEGYDQSAGLLTPQELDDLLAPIALYPDPLIAQILPAATFVDQIDEAARYVRQFGRLARVDDQPWDVSVKAVAHYPDVLYMMDQKYDWTVSLGQAFIDQPQDVMESIQSLRADAEAQGNLFSTPQQQVIDDPDGIRIVPAAPQYVYVPVYDPQVVYVERYNPSYPFISFGVGLAIGAWLSRDFNWREHRVYYHGWRGDGWISRSRPMIHDRGHVYINQRASAINLNKKVMQHDTRRFRQELSSETRRRQEEHRLPPAARPNRPAPARTDGVRPPGAGQQRPPETGRQHAPEAGQQHAPAGGRPQPAATGQPPRPPVTGQGQPRPPATGQGQPRPSVTGQGQPRPPATGQPRPPTIGKQAPAATPAAPPAAQQHMPATGGRPETKPGANDVFRGRDVQQQQPASRSGYGGYGSSKDATSYRQRGQASQENMRQTGRPAPGPRPSAVPAAAPAPRPAAAPAARPAPQAAPRTVRPAMQRPPSGGAPPAPRPAAQPAARPTAPERQQRQ
jgi:hypothetical protein